MHRPSESTIIEWKSVPVNCFIPPARFPSIRGHQPRLHQRRSGLSGLHVPVFSLSLQSDFGDGQTYKRMSWLEHALELEFTSFTIGTDSSPQGKQWETELGHIFAEFRRWRSDILILCHVGRCTHADPLSGFGSRKHILSSLEGFLCRTGLEYVDVLCAHRYDAATPPEETAGALATAVNQGKALYAGLSDYAPSSAHHLVTLLKEIGAAPVLCQATYSLGNRWVEHGLLDILSEHGLGCIATSPLSRISEVGPDGGARVALSRLAKARGQSIYQLALSWVLRDLRVTSVVTTPATATQLDAIHAVASSEVTPEELNFLDACFPPPT
ncbi:aldo/keto reductase [Streptomyces sp. WZ-12]|uniref:aldo/keto reductase n=1 Tax=Streptomyces sp. WZ-12 TaxID=3030210 RepID=UPI00406D3088